MWGPAFQFHGTQTKTLIANSATHSLNNQGHLHGPDTVFGVGDVAVNKRYFKNTLDPMKFIS